MRPAVNQRRYSRITNLPNSIAKPNSPSHSFIVNACQGGACLWLNDQPPIDHGLALRFQWNGRDRFLQSRIVWSRRCASPSNRENPPRVDGWLVGIAFAEDSSDVPITDIHHNIMRADDTKISFLERNDVTARNDDAVERDRRAERAEESLAVTTLNEELIPGLVHATRDLVPVFAKHFSDVRLVCKRDSIEISATFRAPQQTEAEQREARNKPAIAPVRAATETVKQALPVQTEQEVPANADVPSATKTTVPPASNRRWRGPIVIAGVATVIVGSLMLGIWQKSANNLDASKRAVERQSIPRLGVSLDDDLLDGWFDVKTSFDLPVGTLRSAIQIMQANDKYPSAHDLHDLAKYPAQVRRAFSLLAGVQASSGSKVDIQALKDELESRLMAGARFPDEPPGGRYSSLQRELYNNVIVLGVVDLFYRRQDEPVVTDILAAIRRGAQQQSQGEQK